MKQILRVMTGAALFAVACICSAATMHSACAQDTSIVAVVNGQLITSTDVANRTRLLALSTGMQLTPDMMTRMAPQVTRELIDQTLQMQEINKRNIVVPESDILNAVGHIEQGNNMQPGELRAKLQSVGIDFQTLISQLRTEIGWQDVLQSGARPRIAADTRRYRRREKGAQSADRHHPIPSGGNLYSGDRPARRSDREGFCQYSDPAIAAGRAIPDRRSAIQPGRQRPAGR